MPIESPYKPPQSDLGNGESSSNSRKAVFSVFSVIAGYLVVDFGVFVFNRVVVTGMGWSIRNDGVLNVDIALFRLPFNLMFYIAAGISKLQNSFGRKAMAPACIGPASHSNVVFV